jgi:hypothetical protein
MRGDRSVRLTAAVAALSAGLSLAASDLLRLIVPTVDDVACDTGASYAVNLADLVKFVSIGLAVFMLARLASGGISTLARRVATLAATASALTGLANAVEHCAHLAAVGLVYVVSLIVGLAATIWFGILLGRSQDSSRWMGWAIALGTLAWWFGAEQGWGRPVDAITWTAVGVGLLIARPRLPLRIDPTAP